MIPLLNLLSRGCIGRSMPNEYLVALGGAFLEVFLEGRGGRDRLARIFVVLGIGVSGVGHTSGTEFRFFAENNSGDTSSRSRSEGRGADDAKGSNSKSELHF